MYCNIIGAYVYVLAGKLLQSAKDAKNFAHQNLATIQYTPVHYKCNILVITQVWVEVEYVYW